MLPSIWSNNWFDDLFDRSYQMMPWPDERELYGKHARNLMKTDVHETEDSYEMNVDLPGFKKEDIHVDLKEGYLTLRAEKNLEKEEKKEKKVIRSERYVGSMSRSFYVGDVRPESIKCKYEDGVLTLRAEKNLEKEEKKEKKVIRSERYVGSMSRSFYVGDVRPESIKCKYEDGVLTLEFPKAEQKKLPETHSITIE